MKINNITPNVRNYNKNFNLHKVAKVQPALSVSSAEKELHKNNFKTQPIAFGACFGFKEIYRELHMHSVENLMEKAKIVMQKPCTTDCDYEKAQYYLVKAINKIEDKKEAKKLPYVDYKPYKMLGKLYSQKSQYVLAQDCYEKAITELSNQYLVNAKDKDLAEIYQNMVKYRDLDEIDKEYEFRLSQYNSLFFLMWATTPAPEKPKTYKLKDKYLQDYNIYKDILKPCADLYIEMSQICNKVGNEKKQQVYEQIAHNILQGKEVGQEVIENSASVAKNSLYCCEKHKINKK